jgi:aryl-phospho-beta-D-glucosidase BglC (GH1 family)
MRLLAISLAVFALLITACNDVAAQTPETQVGERRNHDANRRLGRTINFGNALEAPSEGAWGVTLQESYFDLVRDVGFDSIRLPLSWTHHTAREAPYAIDDEFFARVDWAIDNALARELNIIINVHHYDELNSNPVSEGARFLAIWRQIAERYQDMPDAVYFEVLNEPHNAFNEDPALWNDLLARALDVIRQSNPTRPVIAGPVGWNNINRLPELQLPDDANLIVTVHFYEPFQFTHQGAEWVGSPPPVGTTWDDAHLSLAWDNWSWDTRVNFVTAPDGRPALEVSYDAGWAGLYLHSGAPAKGYTTLRLATDRTVALEIECGDHTINADSAPNWQPTTVDISSCGDITDLKLKNRSPQPQPPYLLGELSLIGLDSELALLASARDALSAQLSQAKRWADSHGYPLFVGEFGAYSKADLDSRVRWTTAVRELSEALGFSWAYWEFAAGFGIYDPQAETWREPLLRALIPK